VLRDDSRGCSPLPPLSKQSDGGRNGCITAKQDSEGCREFQDRSFTFAKIHTGPLTAGVSSFLRPR